MRRFVVLGLVGALAFTFVGTTTSGAATVSSTWPVGAAPFGLASDGSTGKVYVANSASAVYDINNPSAPARGLISVIDPSTGSVGRILTSQNSDFVLTDSANRRLYSSNATYAATQSSVDVFDLDSGAQVASVSGVGGLMPALDASAGRLFVGGHGLTVIDTATNSVVMSMPSPAGGGAWYGAAVDGGHNRLFLTDGSDTNPGLFVFDARDLSPIGQVALVSTVRYSLAVDPVRHLVFVAGSDPSGGSAATLYVVDVDTLAIVHTTAIQGFPLGIAVAPAQGRLYVSTVGSSSSGTVYGIDDATFDVAETMRIAQFRPGPPLIHPDGRLYIANYNDFGDPARNPPQDSTLYALDLNNHAPVFQRLALSPSTVFTGDTIRADAFASDPDFSASLGGDPVTYTYQWSRNGGVLDGETGSTLDLSTSGNGDRGDTISLRVTASDGRLSTDASTSIVVSDSAPTGTVSLSTVAPATNAVLSARGSATDADNDPISYRFVWKVNGVVRRTTPGLNASDSFDLGLPGNGDHGDAVVVELVVSDGTLDSAVASAGATVVNSAPTVAVSLNTTTPTPKTVLIATVVGQDPDRDGLTYLYTWKLNGVVKRQVTMTATTDGFYISVKGNGKTGDVVTVTVTASDGALTSPAASLSATIR